MVLESQGQARLVKPWAISIIQIVSSVARVVVHYEERLSTMYMGRFTVKKIIWFVLDIFTHIILTFIIV